MYKGNEMVVLDTKKVKGRMVAYYAGLDESSDLLEEVEGFFEEAGIEVSEYDVEEIALELSKWGYSNWDNLHFEIIY